MSLGSWHSSRAHASSTARLWNEDVEYLCEDIEEPPPPDEAPPAFSPFFTGAVCSPNRTSGSNSSAGKNTAISAFRVCLKFLSAARNAQSARPCAAGTTVWLAHTTTASHRYSETAAPSRRERRNVLPAFSSRIRNSSSDSVFPRATAGFVKSPGFFASLHSARNTRNASSSSAKRHGDASVPAEAEGASPSASAASPDAETCREPETSSDAESSPYAIRSFPNDSSVRAGSRFAGVASPSLSNSLSVTSRCCAAADAGTHSTMSSVSSPAAAAATAVRSAPTLLMKPCTKLVICAAASSSVGFTAFAAASAAADTPPRFLKMPESEVPVDSSEVVGRFLPRLARLLEKTSATTMTGGGASGWARDRVSSRWNTTASICVRLALAVVWFTSDAEPRYALTHARTTRRSARARTRNVDELTAVSRHLSICNSTVSSGTSEAAQTNSTSSAACASALTLRVFSRETLVEARARSSPEERRSGVDIGSGSGGLALGSESVTEGAAFSSPAASARAGGGRSASPRRSPCAMSFWTLASVASMIFGDLLAMASRIGTRRSATRSSGRPPPPPADLSSGFLLSRSDVDETTNAPVCSDATSLLTASASSACRFFPAVASRIFVRLSPITSFTSIVAISPRRWVARDSLGSVFHARARLPVATRFASHGQSSAQTDAIQRVSKPG
mmetsp:Transcript_9337/g.39234  ORF Transcript_9337/g.39234 Transcript_9337/m.39234 type:complete len:678 (-) Transcript_9337:73-2106(-)